MPHPKFQIGQGIEKPILIPHIAHFAGRDQLDLHQTLRAFIAHQGIIAAFRFHQSGCQHHRNALGMRIDFNRARHFITPQGDRQSGGDFEIGQRPRHQIIHGTGAGKSGNLGGRRSGGRLRVSLRLQAVTPEMLQTDKPLQGQSRQTKQEREQRR